MIWFEIGIEGKDPLDQDEEDWGRKIEFSFEDIVVNFTELIIFSV